jgi:thiamine-phosphate pyrophosphorylase
VRLHALVDDLETAELALEGGATVLQLRLKRRPAAEVVERGLPFRELATAHGAKFVVNDDVHAALALGADGVHLGQSDSGREQARKVGLLLGVSASSVAQAVEAVEDGASYVGAGPVWATPSKTDADAPIGLHGLAAICEAVRVPVVAIGGVDATNARACVEAGAAGVAVVRAAPEAAAVMAALDAPR